MWGQRPTKTAKATAEVQLTFERADGIALAMQMAAHNAETLRCAAGQVGDTTLDKSPSAVHQLQATANAKAPSRSISCYQCDQTSHVAAQCKFKESKCYHCGKMGHIRCSCCQLITSSD